MSPEVQTPVLESEVLLVTPAMARAWLAARHPNRRILAKRVDELAALMRQDAWHLNGEPLIFDADDILLDGQHRLRLWCRWANHGHFWLSPVCPSMFRSPSGKPSKGVEGDILAMHSRETARRSPPAWHGFGGTITM